MISVTEKAIAEVKRLMAKEQLQDPCLRVKVIGGGCSGMSYKLGFEETLLGEKDKVFEHPGLRLVCDSKSFLFLNGTELDFSDGLNGTGFVFNNPNAKRTCGCGSSFSA
jgi:iron-sulfur cluster assembly protein